MLIDGETSDAKELKWGVPQGSVLGPILFTIYTTPLANVIRKHGVEFHLYADDTQLYLGFKPISSTSKANATSKLEACIEDIRKWMAENLLKLNEDKTEVLLITPREHPEGLSLNVGGFDIKPSETPPRNLGVLFDSAMCMDDQINKLCKALNYKIYSIGKIRRYLDKSTTATLVNCLVTSKLDYCNSLLYGVHDYQIDRLQRCHNNAARVITLSRKYDHITPMLYQLHWLPVKYRIIYKVLVTAHKSLNDHGPVYLKDLLEWYQPPRVLRSGKEFLLRLPSWRLKSIGARRFGFAAPYLWNNVLNIELRSESSVEKFKSDLKTHLFRLAYSE